MNVCNLLHSREVSSWPQHLGLEVSRCTFVEGELNFPKLDLFLVGFSGGMYVQFFFKANTTKLLFLRSPVNFAL